MSESESDCGFQWEQGCLFQGLETHAATEEGKEREVPAQFI